MDRAVLFIDGSNWYHACAALRLGGLSRLNYARLCMRLVEHRTWVGTRYYIGRVPATGNLDLAAAQQRFLSMLLAQDVRISVHLGRLVPRSVTNAAALNLRRYLSHEATRLPLRVREELLAIVDQHARTTVMVEKSVDVQLAVDMVVMAERGLFDTAYLLSADGDLAPAVEAVRQVGKRVMVVSPANAGRLGTSATAVVRLRRPWFEGLFDREQRS